MKVPVSMIAAGGPAGAVIAVILLGFFLYAAAKNPPIQQPNR